MKVTISLLKKIFLFVHKTEKQKIFTFSPHVQNEIDELNNLEDLIVRNEITQKNQYLIGDILDDFLESLEAIKEQRIN